MKKSSLVGIEVFYEEKPVVKPPVAPTWKYGDFDNHEDDDYYGYEDELLDDVEEIISAFEEVHSPVVGRVYKIKGLNLCAKFVGDVYTPLSKGKIRTVSYHKTIFYVDSENMLLASDEEVENYLKESDYNNAS